MRFILTTATAALAIATAGCNNRANDTNDNAQVAEGNAAIEPTANDIAVNEAAANDAAAPATAGAFANTVAASDHYEIDSSKLAATQASSADVKSIAAMLVTDHQKSTADLKAAAAKSDPKVAPDPALSADQQSKIDALKAAKGADFDKLYIDQQIGAHQKALSVLQSYSAGGDSPPLKEFAGKTAPVVQTHLGKLNGLKK